MIALNIDSSIIDVTITVFRCHMALLIIGVGGADVDTNYSALPPHFKYSSSKCLYFEY